LNQKLRERLELLEALVSVAAFFLVTFVMALLAALGHKGSRDALEELAGEEDW